MPYDLSKILVIAISTRALFDLEKDNEIYENEGVKAYIKYELDNVDNILRPGTAFRLVKKILALNSSLDEKLVEVIVLSRNNAVTSLRITQSIEHHGLDIVRSAWTGGEEISRYLHPYKVDLFLSANEHDVQESIDAGFAAARIYKFGKYTPETRIDKQLIKIAFDGDAVLFSDSSEKIYKEKGLEEFIKHERENAKNPCLKGHLLLY